MEVTTPDLSSNVHLTRGEPNENTTLPEIDVAGCPLVDSIKDSKQLLRGSSLFLENGFLIIRNAFDAGFIDKLLDEYLKKYDSYFADKQYPDAQATGDKRTMVSVALEGVFNSPEFYANPRIYPLLRYLLGPDLIINSISSVVSLPGAPDQRVHRDVPNIYVTELNRSGDFSWLKYVPPYAVTLGIPLVPISKLTGNTRFWPGTHLFNAGREHPIHNSGVDFTAETGTCVMFDYRVLHAGLANNSDKIRPIMYNVYSRPWYRDHVNYTKQDPIIITEEQFREIPQSYHHLFAWALKREINPK
jgi:hypothetical protein